MSEIKRTSSQTNLPQSTETDKNMGTKAQQATPRSSNRQAPESLQEHPLFQKGKKIAEQHSREFSGGKTIPGQKIGQQFKNIELNQLTQNSDFQTRKIAAEQGEKSTESRKSSEQKPQKTTNEVSIKNQPEKQTQAEPKTSRKATTVTSSQKNKPQLQKQNAIGNLKQQAGVQSAKFNTQFKNDLNKSWDVSANSLRDGFLRNKKFTQTQTKVSELATPLIEDKLKHLLNNKSSNATAEQLIDVSCKTIADAVRNKETGLTTLAEQFTQMQKQLDQKQINATEQEKALNNQMLFVRFMQAAIGTAQSNLAMQKNDPLLLQMASKTLEHLNTHWDQTGSAVKELRLALLGL